MLLFSVHYLLQYFAPIRHIFAAAVNYNCKLTIRFASGLIFFWKQENFVKTTNWKFFCCFSLQTTKKCLSRFLDFFRCQFVLSTCHLVYLPVCQLAVLSTINVMWAWYLNNINLPFINLLFHQFVLSTCCFVNLPFLQLADLFHHFTVS